MAIIAPTALIFDVDGTLAETEELHRKAFNATFTEYGLNRHWDKALYGQLLKVAGGQNRLRHYIKTCQPQRAGEFIDRVGELHRQKTIIYGQMLAEGHIRLRPGIEHLILQAVEQDIRLAIATSTSRINVDKLFEATLGMTVLDKFEAICCGNDVDAVKPAPDLYLLALKRLGLPPEECLAFEDSEIGLKAACAAGIPTIITISTYCQDDDFTGAQKVMSDLLAGDLKL